MWVCHAVTHMSNALDCGTYSTCPTFKIFILLDDMLVSAHFFLYILYIGRSVLPKHAVIVQLSAFL